MAEWPMKDQVCIVGIGETEFTKWGQIARSEFQLACEAIIKAVDDAGLSMDQIDGVASYAMDRNDPVALQAALGFPQLRFSNMQWGGGGGGGSGAVQNAAAAIYAGLANYVVVFRSLAQGQFGRFGQSRSGGRVSGGSAFNQPYGLFSPAQQYGLTTRRHMHEFGTTSRHLGAIAVACRKHAQRNPRAVMYGKPITLEDHQNSRMIADPYRLLDCCLENDGSAAVVLTSAERARDLKQPPVYIMAAAQGSGPRWTGFNQSNFLSANFEETAKDLYARAGVTPKDIDVAQIYENFTGQVLMSIEDHGFCARGEGGAFVSGGRIEWPDGELPINTSGGNLS
jgi:acetyl-CoA acetyltransferase